MSLQSKDVRIIYGVGPVREVVARRPRAITSIWVDPKRTDKHAGDPVAQIVTAARSAGIRVEDRDRLAMEHGVGEGVRHQGVLAFLGPYIYADLDTLLEIPARTAGDQVLAGRRDPPLLLALDGVQDPRNFGAVLRSAYLLGAGGVIITNHRAAQVTGIVAKTSAGASELIPIARVGNLVHALERLRELGLWRVAVHAAPQAKPISDIDGTLPLALVVGGEGSGVRPLVASHCDFHSVIPMQHAEIGSFNVSVAAAIALYEIRRQRGEPSLANPDGSRP